MNEYVTLEELKNSSELFGLSFVDYDATRAIAAASRGIDEYCGRRFFSDGTETVRYYSPVEWGYVQIDDMISCSSISTDQDNDGTFETAWTVNKDYFLEPLNAAADGKPYEQVRINPSGSLRWPWWSWKRSVAVTGTFGWPAVPDQVREATTILASRLIRRKREAPFAVIGMGLDSAGVRIAKTDPDVCFLLDNLVRDQGVFVA